MINNGQSPSAHNRRGGYPPELTKILGHMPPGPGNGVVLIFEGFRISEALAASSCDLQPGGIIHVRVTKSFSGHACSISLSPTALPYLGVPKSKRAGPLVTDRSGNRIRPAELAREWRRACRRAGVDPIPLHDLRRLGLGWAANGVHGYSQQRRSLVTASAASKQVAVAAAAWRRIDCGENLPELMDGTDLALCVYYRRPALDGDAATWVDGLDVNVTSEAPADITARAIRYATAMGLSEEPQTTVTTATLLRLALCWTFEDGLTAVGREIFSAFVADGMPAPEAREAARLLSGRD